MAVVDEMIPYALAGSVPAFALFPKKKTEEISRRRYLFSLVHRPRRRRLQQPAWCAGVGVSCCMTGHGRPAAAFLVV